ncbi:hypothetical protein F183_A49320 [Bryobacterales bacterium F-183]|nr:hypothetical protein F183_A49320 [Bryobacterales bacterium F-183]
MESDHQHAVASQAVERYLLGDLEPALRARFEEHFFGCPTCAEALRTGAVLEEAARALLQADPSLNVAESRRRAGIVPSSDAAAQGTQDAQVRAAADRRSGWMPRPGVRVWVPWAVALFFAVVSFQQYRELAAPRIESAAPLILRADARGAAVSASASADTAISLTIDVPTDGLYHWNLYPNEGKTRLTGEAKSVRGALVIIIGAGTLEPGVYTVALARKDPGGMPLPDRLYYFELTRAQKN